VKICFQIGEKETKVSCTINTKTMLISWLELNENKKFEAENIMFKYELL